MFEEIGAFDPVPREEVLRRIDGLQGRMAGTGIDYAVVLQNVDRFYFTGHHAKGRPDYTGKPGALAFHRERPSRGQGAEMPFA